MAYTKQFGSHAKVTIDDVDVSNSFRTFSVSSEHAREEVGGFSASGKQEYLAGLTDASFTGVAYATEELRKIVGPLHFNKTICSITYQPNGLVDATNEIYYGECQILRWEPESEFGAVMTMQFTATPADENGIRVTDWT